MMLKFVFLMILSFRVESGTCTAFWDSADRTATDGTVDVCALGTVEDRTADGTTLTECCKDTSCKTFWFNYPFDSCDSLPDVNSADEGPCGDGRVKSAKANPGTASLDLCCGVDASEKYQLPAAGITTWVPIVLADGGTPTACEEVTGNDAEFSKICNDAFDCKGEELTQATKCYGTSCEDVTCVECGFLDCRNENSCLGASVSTAGNTEVSCYGINSCGCVEPATGRGSKDSTCATISTDLDVGCESVASCYRADMIKSQDTVDCEGAFSCSNDIMPYDTDKFPIEVVDTSDYEFDMEVNAPTVSCSSYACLGAKLVANDIIQCSGDSACYGAKTKINDKNGQIICGGSLLDLDPFVSTSTGWVNTLLSGFDASTCANDDVGTISGIGSSPLSGLQGFDNMLRGPEDTGTPAVVAAVAVTESQTAGSCVEAAAAVTAVAAVPPAPIGQTATEAAAKGMKCADFAATTTLKTTVAGDLTKLTRAAVMADPLFDALMSSGSCAKAHLRGTLPVGADALRNDRPHLECQDSFSCYKASIKMEVTCMEADSCMGATFDTDFNCDHEDACHETVAAKGSGAICCGPGCANANRGTDSKDKVHEGCTDEASDKETRAGYEKCYKCEKLSAVNFLTKTKTGLIILCVFIVLILIGVIVGLVFLKNKMMKPQIENLDAEK